MVYKLHKAQYGLKQAPRAWNKRIDQFLIPLGFKKYIIEYGVYVMDSKGSGSLIVCLYVDDILITGSDSREIEKFKLTINKEFEMTDLGELSYFLGMEFVKTKKGMIMHNRKCITDEKVDATMYKQLVGSPRYLCNSRPDICYALCVISKFMNEPKKSHLIVAKRILRHVKGTINYGILFPIRRTESQVELVNYTDSNWCETKLIGGVRLSVSLARITDYGVEV
ncbi:putative copia-type protein [Trifolium pratense]|uniref:Putative copia-type protein n=1 Tax=Trifolium pratense TaxID=57577 RepID=A0A2K3P0V3_TRIPR|nr:putative copia-type protein [Trifolium pratense]